MVHHMIITLGTTKIQFRLIDRTDGPGANFVSDQNGASCAAVQEWAELGWAGPLESVMELGWHHGNMCPRKHLGTAYKMMSVHLLLSD